MSNPSPPPYPSLLGEIFEIGAKRGILAQFAHSELLGEGDAGRFSCLAEWRRTTFRTVIDHAIRVSGFERAVEPESVAAVTAHVSHLLHNGYGIGWTAARMLASRTWHGPQGKDGIRLEGLWGGPTLSPWHGSPEERDRWRIAQQAEGARLFEKDFPVTPGGSYMHKGGPGNADLMVSVCTPRRRWLVAFEFSLNADQNARDMRFAEAHDHELRRHLSLQRMRGVFSDISAELDGTPIALNPAIVRHLPGMTSVDKPLYKLMQACSYATRMSAALPEPGRGGTSLHAVAITGAGFEAISAKEAAKERSWTVPPKDSRLQLMRDMGKTYIDAVWDYDIKDRADYVREHREELRNSALGTLKPRVANEIREVVEGRSSRAVAIETMKGIPHPTRPLDADEVKDWLAEAADVLEILGETPESFMAAAMALEEGDVLNLRGLNGLAVSRIISTAPPGVITAAALLGMPGIGKTHAAVASVSLITEHLNGVATAPGALFFYYSPRVVINADLAEKVVKNFPNGSICITTDRKLMEAGPGWATEQGIQGPHGNPFQGAIQVEVSGAGRGGAEPSERPILHLNKVDAQRAIDEVRRAPPTATRDLEASTRRVKGNKGPGILSTVAAEARWLLANRPECRVMTVMSSIQAYKETGKTGGTTIERLSGLFQFKADTPSGLAERRALAQRMPLVIFMVDEITGDGAGVPLCHALAEWMRKELLIPFDNEPGGSPFRCVLLLADASLSTPQVFSSQMASEAIGGNQAPPRVIMGTGEKSHPFWMSRTQIKLDQFPNRMLNVMVNGYPATRLDIAYDVSLQTLQTDEDNVKRSTSAEIRDQHGHSMLDRSVERVREALLRDPMRQCILFAEDKRFLRDLKSALVERLELDKDQVANIDSKVSLAVKRRLMREDNRDRVRVWLMTSAGARGISFPLASTIIIQFPRFSVESELMEMAQAVYRGRGNWLTTPWEERVDGNSMPRRIVLVVEDYVLRGRRDTTEATERNRNSKALDIVNFLALARATLETRFRGRSKFGIEGTAVPVGPVGTEAIAEMMATGLRDFIHECSLVRSEKGDAAGLASAALQDAQRIFGSSSAQGISHPPGFESLVTDSPFATRYRMALEAPNAPLFGGHSDLPVLPDHIYQVGPVLYECWNGVEVDELFDFNQRADSLSRIFMGQLNALIAHDDTTYSLRRKTQLLRDILSRDNAENEGKAFKARQRMTKSTLWCVGMADHSRFVAPHDLEGGRPGAESLGDDWRDLIAAAAQSYRRSDNVFPYLPGYTQAPFVLVNCAEDPTGLERVFRDSTLMASSELNILSAILRPRPEMNGTD